MASERQGSLGRGARVRILAAARRLFRDPGINATGVAELAATARVSKRTLYQHFASKDELIVAYLRDLDRDEDVGPAAVLSREDLAPRARLLELFAALGEGPRPLRGDPFINAAVELADPRHPGHRVAAEHRVRFTQRLADLAFEAGAHDADRVARQLGLLYAGAAAQCVVDDEDEPVADALALARTVLADALD